MICQEVYAYIDFFTAKNYILTLNKGQAFCNFYHNRRMVLLGADVLVSDQLW